MSNCNRLSSLLFSSKLYMQGKTYFDANLIPAIEEALKEHEKSNCDTYRDLCAELLVELSGLYENVSSEIHKEHRALVKSVITKAEKILGEKNGTAN